MSDLNDAQLLNDPALKEYNMPSITALPSSDYDLYPLGEGRIWCVRLRGQRLDEALCISSKENCVIAAWEHYQEGKSVHVNSAGTYRSEEKPKYTLIPHSAIKRLAKVLTAGGDKYGEYNWEKGLSIRSCLDHAYEHLGLFLAGDRSEDHLGHAFCNLAFCIESQEKWPHLNTDLRPTSCSASTSVSDSPSS